MRPGVAPTVGGRAMAKRRIEAPAEAPTPDAPAAAPPPPKPRGRPKGAGRIASKVTMVATPEYMAWLKELAAHVGHREIGDTIRDALHKLAEGAGFRAPPRL